MSASSSSISREPSPSSTDADDFHRLRHSLQVALQLRLQAAVEHGAQILPTRSRGRRQGLGARSPLRRTHLARMRGDVLRGLDLAQQLLRIAADAVVVDLDDLDLALADR